MSYRIDWRELNDYVSKRQLWLNVFNELIPGALGDALSKFSPNNHANAKTSCPSSEHGATTKSKNTSGKAYGLLPRAAESGGSVCNSCGAQSSGFSTIMFCTDWTFGQTVKAIAATKTVGWIQASSNYAGPVKPLRKWVAPPVDMEKENRKFERNQAIVNECLKLDHPKAELARLYLKNRGIRKVHTFSNDVLFHPELPYYAKLWDLENQCLAERPVLLTKLPALVSKIRQPGGKFVNLHCTYFGHDGAKAKDLLWNLWCQQSGIEPQTVTPEFYKKYAPDVKKMRSRIEHMPIKGGGVHVCMPAELMGVSEGLENIASVIDDTEIACWGLLNAGMMRKWLPTNITKAVIIFADHDPGGLKSAVHLKERLEKMGVFCLIITPHLLNPEEPENMDWNDFYLKYGPGSLAMLFDEQFIEDMLNGAIDPFELPEWAYEK